MKQEATPGPLRVAILGGGAVTVHFYLPALAMLTSRFSVTCIADASPSAETHLRRAGYRGRFVCKTYSDFFNDDINLEQTDAIIIALPNYFHEAATLLALKNGIAVLCEKPLTLTEAGAQKIYEASRKCGRPVAVGMVRRYLPSFFALRRALKQGLIGAVEKVEVHDGNPFSWLSDSGAFFRPESGGVLADMGIHYLDLLVQCFETVEPVSYTDDWNGGCEASATFQLLANSTIPVTLGLSRLNTLANRFVITGSEGILRVEKDVFSNCTWIPKRIEGLTAEIIPDTPFSNSTWPRNFTSAFAEQFSQFADALNGGQIPPVTVPEAIRSIRLLEWAYKEREKKNKIAKPQGTISEIDDVFLTGGTGFIGGHLAERIAKNGASKIIAPVRNYKTCTNLARNVVQMPRLDLLDKDAVSESMKGSRYVFHLAYGREGTTRAGTVDTTKNVVNAAIENGAESVVILSTIWVFGIGADEREIDETATYDPFEGYGAEKAEMEKWCLNRAKTSGKTRICILNVSCVYGPHGKTYTTLPLALAKQNQFCWIDEGAGIVNYTYIDNLIDAILLAATSKQSHQKRIIINDGWCTWRDFLSPFLGHFADQIPSYSPDELRQQNKIVRPSIQATLKGLLRNPEVRKSLSDLPLVNYAKSILKKRAPSFQRAIDEASPSGDPSPATPPAWLETLFGANRHKFKNNLAEKILGWTPQIPLPEGQKQTVEWLNETGRLEKKTDSGLVNRKLISVSR